MRQAPPASLSMQSLLEESGQAQSRGGAQSGPFRQRLSWRAAAVWLAPTHRPAGGPVQPSRLCPLSFVLRRLVLQILAVPDFDNALPSRHYSGYVEVDAAHKRNLFYYFVEASPQPH
jgi:hypothetical protein